MMNSMNVGKYEFTVDGIDNYLYVSMEGDSGYFAEVAGYSIKYTVPGQKGVSEDRLIDNTEKTDALIEAAHKVRDEWEREGMEEMEDDEEVFYDGDEYTD